MFYLIPTMNINNVVRVIYYVNSTNSFHNHFITCNLGLNVNLITVVSLNINQFILCLVNRFITILLILKNNHPLLI
jgi:hypothetical protein